MANGYDPGAFDIIREEFQRDDRDRDRFREEERRLSEQRDIDRDRLREDDRDALEQRRLDDALKQRRLDDALELMVNDDSLTLNPEMVEVINDPQMRMTRGREITRKTGRDVIRRSGQFSRAALLPNLPTKKKRKISKYQKEFGKQLKMLKAKHPRTPITRLMKRAHSATRKAMK